MLLRSRPLLHGRRSAVGVGTFVPAPARGVVRERRAPRTACCTTLPTMTSPPGYPAATCLSPLSIAAAERPMDIAIWLYPASPMWLSRLRHFALPSLACGAVTGRRARAGPARDLALPTARRIPARPADEQAGRSHPGGVPTSVLVPTCRHLYGVVRESRAPALRAARRYQR